MFVSLLRRHELGLYWPDLSRSAFCSSNSKLSKLYLQCTGSSQPEAPDSSPSLLQTRSNGFYGLIYYSNHFTSQCQLPIEVTFPITVTEYLTRRTYKNIYFGSRYEGAGWYGGKKWYSWSQCINNPEGDPRQEVGQGSRTLFSQWPTSSSQGLYLKVTQPSITYYHLRIKHSNPWTYRRHFIFKL